ncbi:MAG: hypothetical protein IT369_00930 [Candidatus Latescibacteria bacterium]|nr:hypothetical protein [Candidatus Latescibacterota bacterium]
MSKMVWFCGALLVVGCSQNVSEKKPEEVAREQGLQSQSSQAAPSAQQLPSGHPPVGQPGGAGGEGGMMPAGHPPVAGAGGSGAVTDIKPGQRQSLGGMSVVMPEGWKSMVPSSSMRTAEYLLPGEGGADASLVVFYFGPDQGGSVEANIDRWYGQFTQPDGKSTKERSQRSEKTVGNLKVTLVDINGTYTGGGMGGGSPAAQTGYRMLGAIVVAPRGPYFFKLVGPAAVVARWTSSFDQYVDSALPE